MASTSPVWGSMAMIAPLRSPRAFSAARWMSRSMVRRRLCPGLAGSVPSLPTSRPWLSTITSWEPSTPRRIAVIGGFHAGSAHHVAGLIDGVARIVEHLLAHLAHVADQVRREAVARIKAALLLHRVQLGQLVLVRLDELLFVRRDVLLQRQRLVFWGGAVLLQDGVDLIDGHIQSAGDQRQIRVDVVALLADQEAGDGGVVVDDQTAFAVEDLAPRREDRAPCGCDWLRPAHGSSGRSPPAAATAQKPECP